VAVVLPTVEAFLLAHSHLLRTIPPDLNTSALFERAIALLVMALLLGYLGEQQKRLRAEKTVITTMLSKARVEAGIPPLWQAVLRILASSTKRATCASRRSKARDSACLRGSCRRAGGSNGSTRRYWIASVTF